MAHPNPMLQEKITAYMWAQGGAERCSEDMAWYFYGNCEAIDFERIARALHLLARAGLIRRVRKTRYNDGRSMAWRVAT